MPAKENSEFNIKYSKRSQAFLVLLTVFIVGLVWRLFEIQILDHAGYQSEAASKFLRKEDVQADRGRIYDRNGKLLAMNTTTYDIGARLKDISDPDTSFMIIAEVTGRSPSYYRSLFKDSTAFVYLEKNVPLDQALQILDYKGGRVPYPAVDPAKLSFRRRKQGEPRRLTGVRLDKRIRRQYPYNEAAGQVLGFIGSDFFGLSGIEKSCDTLLAGRNGHREIFTDGKGQPLLNSRENYRPPVHGKDIYLSLDINYQIILEEEIRQTVARTYATSGMGMIMNPNTGEILAMASIPDFNPNDFRSEDVERQKNRPVTDTYEPGSVFKVIPISTALEEDVFSTGSIINCENGKWRIFDRTLHDDHPSDWSTVSDILVHSSNIGTAKITEKLGNLRLYQMIRKYGVGDVKSLDLPGVVSGSIRRPEDWEPITNSQVGIGQSVTTTLLELTSLYSAIANGGRLMRPRIISEIHGGGSEGVQRIEPKFERRVISEETARTMTDLLEKVVLEGTGKNAAIPGYHVAGKTGTAQKVVNGKYSYRNFHSTFVGFFPASKPVLLCAIAIDDPRYGRHTASVSAAPAVQAVFSRIINSTEFEKLYDWVEDEQKMIANAPSEEGSQQSSLSLSMKGRQGSDADRAGGKSAEQTFLEAPVIMPDVEGRPVKQARYLLSELGLECNIDGDGTRVTAQKPAAGDEVYTSTICELNAER